jgi:glycosyltransferase involved in cell wall biosynthesis
MSTRVMIALNLAWNLVNFRAGLIRALVAAGYEVVAVAPPDEYAPQLAALGCRFVPLPMDNQGTHPGRDLLLLGRFVRLLRRERPAVFLGYTVKPNVYGSLAAHALGIPVVNNIAGLGAVFIRDSVVTRVVRGLYRLALGRSRRVFFQNDEDLRLFVEGGLVRPEVTGRVPGSGIDLGRFAPVGLPWGGAQGGAALSPDPAPARERGESGGGGIRFLLIARMLWDKGVGEYVEAARRVKRRYPDVEFGLLGFLDVKNPAAISREQMDAWVAEGVVNYLGVSDDVREQIAEADCVVLPSYREGTPRTLLEAAAMARPLIATDAVGCREVVEDGVNGYLCRVKDADDLAKKMERMIGLSDDERTEMGRRGREKVEREFDERFVIEAYLKAIREVCGARR